LTYDKNRHKTLVGAATIYSWWKMPESVSIKKSITGDIFGGVTAAVIALPLALAFGVASGAGAEAGLYGAIILGFTAALLGGTSVQISGPTGPMTVVAASAIALFKGDMGAIVTIVFLGGVFQMLLGFLKVGKLVRYIPYPVISGFMTGIGFIIILLQIHPLAGAGSFSSPLLALKHMGDVFRFFQPDDLILGILTLIIVFFFPKKLSRIFPSPLAALLAGTALSVLAGMNVSTIGHIPMEMPEFYMPELNISQLTFVISTALSLAVLGSIDSLLTSLVADSLTRTTHKPNKELFAQGLGNTLVSLVGGLPGAGATMRTVVNIKSGGTTRLSGIIHSVVLLLILLVFGHQAEYIPMAVLSGILIKVGFDIVDYRFLKLLKRAPRHDLIIMFAVLTLTVLVDLIVAVGVGIVLASILLTYRISQQTHTNIMELPIEISEHEMISEIHTSTKFCIRVVDIDGPFFFGSTTQIVGKIGALLGTRIVVFNCKKVPFIDYSAVFALSEKITKLRSHNIMSMIVVNDSIKEELIKNDITAFIQQEHIFSSLESAVEHAKKYIQQDILLK